MQQSPSRPAAAIVLRAFLDSAWRGGPSLLLFILCTVGGGLLSAQLGTDRNWDLKNYHLYGPYALLHGRMLFDVAPAQVQSFFNPYLHLPHHILFFAMDGRPKGFAFVMGLPAGVFAFLMLRVAWDHAAQVVRPGLQAWAAVAAFGALGLTGAAVLPGVGLSTFDVVVAVPVALAYLLVLRAVIARAEGRPVGLRGLALAGAVAGLAGGLKLTVLPFAAAIGVMLLLLLGFRAAVVAGVAMVAGFLLGFAPFAWQLWQAFGNPMFPHFNQVFRSPDWVFQHFADLRFLPRTTLQAVFYPFWWLAPTSGLVSELRLRDPRFAIAYVAWFVLLAMVLLRRKEARNRAALLALGVLALCYAAWVKQFGIYRYLVFPEALAGIVTMLAVVTVWPRQPWPGIFGLAFVAWQAMAFTIHPNWGHGPHVRRLLASEPLPVEPGAMVVSVDSTPMAYLVTLMPRDARVLGLATNLVQPGQDHGLNRRIAMAIADQSGPIWSLAGTGTTDAARDAVLAVHGLAVDGECLVVRDTLEPGGHRFCPLRKAG
jgi:hypothetical protein